MASRAEIGISDLVKALGVLHDDTEENYESIANCLGFTTHHAPSPYKSTRGAWNRQTPKDKPIQAKPPSYKPSYAMPPAPKPVSKILEEILNTTLKEQSDRPPQEPAGISQDTLQDIEALLLTTDKTAPPRHLLFPKKTARGIITESLMQPTTGGDIDVDKIIQAYVRQQPLRHIPYKQLTSIYNGCQLLLDFSEALMPWWEDMRSLIQQFQNILGKELCPVYEFDNDPSEAIQWTESGEKTWNPIENRPVVIASDLGAINTPKADFRSAKSNWLRIINICKQKNTPIIILNPLHHSSWDNLLSQKTIMIHWNPATNAGDVQRLMQEVRSHHHS